jgi:hypothetical protein
MYESKFSQFTFAMLTLLGFIAMFLGSMIYNIFFKNFEERGLLAFAMIVNCFGSVGTLLYVTDNMFGINPIIFVAFTSTVTDTMFLALYYLPSMVLFAKLVPTSIEASMFALLMGILNLSFYVVSKLIGNAYNSFIGIDKNHLDEIWKLYVIETIGTILPILFLWLLPNKVEVSAV